MPGCAYLAVEAEAAPLHALHAALRVTTRAALPNRREYNLWYQERVVFGVVIGQYVDPTGAATPTTAGIIHYSKDGIHIVPGRPL